MSYASVAARNAPSPSEQPRPDPALLTTDPPTADNIADDAVKLNIVSPNFKSNPETATSKQDINIGEQSPLHVPQKSEKSNKDHWSPRVDSDDTEACIFGWVRQYILRPSVAGGLLGIVNVGLLSGIGYLAYTRPHLRQDTRVVSATVIGSLAVIGVEGQIAHIYGSSLDSERRNSARSERRIGRKASAFLSTVKEHVLRPGVLGGIAGIVNAGVLGTVGYLMYSNWDRHWDRRSVSGISVALLTLWMGEGYLAERRFKEGQ